MLDSDFLSSSPFGVENGPHRCLLCSEGNARKRCLWVLMFSRFCRADRASFSPSSADGCFSLWGNEVSSENSGIKSTLDCDSLISSLSGVEKGSYKGFLYSAGNASRRCSRRMMASRFCSSHRMSSSLSSAEGRFCLGINGVSSESLGMNPTLDCDSLTSSLFEE